MTSDFGRPFGSGEYGVSRCRSYRLSYAAHAWITHRGGRDFLEALVPQSYRKGIDDQIKAQLLTKQDNHVEELKGE